MLEMCEIYKLEYCDFPGLSTQFFDKFNYHPNYLSIKNDSFIKPNCHRARF